LPPRCRRVSGGWDGNTTTTYQRQGCGDGVLIQREENIVIRGNAISDVFDAGIESSVSNGPITAVIESNTIARAGFTGIGSYYIEGWRDSVFRNNVITDSPSLLNFNTIGADFTGSVTTFTFVGNTIVGNALRNPTLLPMLYGGGRAPGLTVDYVSPGRIHTVSGNAVTGNDLGLLSPPPVLRPAGGFVDGGGNVCQSGPESVLACGGVE
jgi:hypothetical protein